MVVLVESKIQKPVHFEKWISRESMFTVRHEAVQSNVLFISAPTGYGKTTFLTRWSEELDEHIAWLSVDESDNQALHFFGYIIYTVYSACNLLPKKKLQKKLAKADRNELDAMWSYYKELDRGKEKSVRLIIDDFHHINDPELLEMIQYFVVNLPESLKICFASRHLPPFTLALWQSLLTVTEVRMQQLRITDDDMKSYLKQHPQQQGSVWQEFIQTEGWPAGLQEVLQSQGISHQLRSDRHRQFTMNVLTNDLWSNFSGSAQHFLLVTSILDTMNQQICDALLESKESLIHLKNLEEKGFFIESDSEIDTQYRYHPLFAVALRQNLQKNHSKEFVSALHRKAAGIYFRQGNVVEAITHALKGQAYPLASTWMMHYGEDFIKDKKTASFISWCKEFEKIHIPLAFDLQLLFAFALLAEHQVDEADHVMNQMTAQGNRKEWNAFTERSRSAAYDYFLIKSYITIIRMGGVTEVGQWLQKGFDLHVEKSSKLYVLPLQFNKVEPVLLRTPLGSAKKLGIQQTLLEIQSCQTNKLSIIGYYHGIQAETLYVTGSIKEARQQQVEALLLAHHFQDPGLLIPMYVLSCKLHIANGEMEKAHETIRSALLYTEDGYWKGFLYAFEAFLHLKQDHLEDAEMALSMIQRDYAEGIQQHPFVALVEARLLLRKGQWEEALEKTLCVKFEALEERQVVTYIEATILESSCYARMAYWPEMAQSLQDAMAYSKEYGYTQLFVEEDNMEDMLKEYVKLRKQQIDREWTQVPHFYVERLIQATKERNPVLELLTPREQEVFSLLVLGETNYKIAKNLALTEGSVRIYLTSIYEKLCVNSRKQAMLKAYK